jgi:hypothetical protein
VTVLGAHTTESRLARNGDLVAEMHAMGYRFRFRVAPAGHIVERSCHPEPAGIMCAPELQVLRDLVEAEMARMGHGHLRPERHGPNVFVVLGRAEIKLSMALANDLSRIERQVVDEALENWMGTLDPTDSHLTCEAERSIELIRQKLGV